MTDESLFGGMVPKTRHGLVMQLSAVLISISFIFMSGCAGVTVTPLKPDGTKDETAEAGLRYYMPSPYLLVVALPPTAPVSSNMVVKMQPLEVAVSPGATSGNMVVKLPQFVASVSPASASDTQEQSKDEKSHDTAGLTGNGTGNNTDKSDTSNQGGSSNPAPITDTSFLANTPEYMVKLIYLPDMQHPMAMTEHTGLFGTSEMKPVLQDGWMLTSLDATADSKMAETLTAIGSIMGSAMTGGAAAGGKAATGGGKTKGTSADFASKPAEKSGVLRPGLYKFNYAPDGTLVGLTPVKYFQDYTGNISTDKVITP